MLADLRSKAGRETSEEAVPWASTLDGGQACVVGEDEGPCAFVGPNMDSDSHSSPARQGVDARGCGNGSRDLSAGGAACRNAVSRAWARSRLERRSAPEALEDAEREATGIRDRSRVYRSPRGTREVDDGASRGGSGSARRGAEGKQRNDPSNASRPRHEAVAGKKCGAFRNWTASTSAGWRTSWTS